MFIESFKKAFNDGFVAFLRDIFLVHSPGFAQLCRSSMGKLRAGCARKILRLKNRAY